MVERTGGEWMLLLLWLCKERWEVTAYTGCCFSRYTCQYDYKQSPLCSSMVQAMVDNLDNRRPYMPLKSSP